jgi:uncharacterized protein YrrD
LGLAVYSQKEGKRVGQVAGFLVDRQRRHVELLAVSSGAFSHLHYLPFSRVHNIGQDALMIESEAILMPQLPPEQRLELDASLSGRSVLTQSGERLGEITDYQLDEQSGKIEAYQFRVAGEGLLARLLSLGRHETVRVADQVVIALGADALVVPDDVTEISHPASSGEARE